LIKNAHYRNRALNLKVLELARTFGPAMGCNLYYTPAQQSGFSLHSDLHHSIIWQIEGTKTWTVEGRTFTLHTGDALVLPKGVLHQARTSTQASLHATFSVHLLSFMDVLEQLQDKEVSDTADCQRAWQALQEQTLRLTELLQSARAKWVSTSGVLENTNPIERSFSADTLYRWRADRFIQIVADQNILQILSTKKSWTLANLPEELRVAFTTYQDFIPAKLPSSLVPVAEEWFNQRLLCPLQP
jgi:mannose-6-phosphate isomerase-like protein (cupin superfamily)